MQTKEGFKKWLTDFLGSLKYSVDADTFSQYFLDILYDDTLSNDEKSDSIEDIFHSLMSPPDSKNASKEILLNYFKVIGSSNSTNNLNECVDSSLEDQLRAMICADNMRFVAPDKPSSERDQCTKESLRAAGVKGYQDDLDAEHELSIATANAEFYAKQRLLASSGIVPSADFPVMENADSDDSELDAEIVEIAAGYGKKDDLSKRGSIQDALACLNPILFSSKDSSASSLPKDSTSLTRRLPTPGDISRAMLPGGKPSGTSTTDSLLATSGNCADTRRTGRERDGEVSNLKLSAGGGSQSGNSSGGPVNPGRKAPVSRHLANVCSRAEIRWRLREAKAAASGLGSSANAPLGSARARFDELDAFRLSDSSEDAYEDDITDGSKEPVDLPPSCSNRERQVAAEKSARQAARTAEAERKAQNKLDRAKQLEANAARKAAAQKKVAKQERKR